MRLVILSAIFASVLGTATARADVTMRGCRAAGDMCTYTDEWRNRVGLCSESLACEAASLDRLERARSVRPAPEPRFGKAAANAAIGLAGLIVAALAFDGVRRRRKHDADASRIAETASSREELRS